MTGPPQSALDWFAANRDGLMLGTIVAAAIVGLMLVVRGAGEWLARRHPGCRDWQGVLGSVLARTGLLFMVAAAIEIVAAYADAPARIDRAATILFTVAAALQAAVWARELVIGAIQARVADDRGESTLSSAMAIIRVLVSITVFAVALLAILDNLGVNVTTLVAGLGIGGIAIGLAAQGIFSDLFAALSILFDRPFRRGDLIRYGATIGTVERIGLKSTRLRAQSGEQVIMANTKLLEQEVHNLADAHVRRTVVPLSLVYQTPPDKLEALPALAAEAVAAAPDCRLVRALVTAFAPSSIDCQLVYDDGATDPETLARNKSAILIAVAKLLARDGIAFAYPTQTSFTAAPDGRFIMPYPGSPAPPPR